MAREEKKAAGDRAVACAAQSGSMAPATGRGDYDPLEAIVALIVVILINWGYMVSLFASPALLGKRSTSIWPVPVATALGSFGTSKSFPYGERQYSCLDPAGHAWTFSETVRDTNPAEWGGELAPGAR